MRRLHESKDFNDIGSGDLVEDWNGTIYEVLDTGTLGDLCDDYPEYSPDREDGDEDLPAVYAVSDDRERVIMVYGEENGGCTYHEGEKTYKLEVEVTIPGDLDVRDVAKAIERHFSQYSADVTDWEEA
jgi:hypothetical protein